MGHLRLVHLGEPLLYLLLGLLARNSVAFLNLPDEQIALAVNLLKVIISELPEMRPGGALQLLPLTLNLIPVHDTSSLRVWISALAGRTHTEADRVPKPRFKRLAAVDL